MTAKLGWVPLSAKDPRLIAVTTHNRLLRHCDFRAAEKRRILINNESRRFDVPAQSAARRKFAPFSGENVTLDLPAYFYGFRSDLALNVRVLSNGQLPRRI